MKYIVTLFIALLFVSCSPEQVVTRYYILDADNLEQENRLKPTVKETLPYTAELKMFTIAKPYDMSRIALRTSTHELSYYYYHHWAENPATAVSYFVWENISDANIFNVFEPDLFNITADYEITGVIDQLERTDIDDNYSAHLKMRMQLKNPLTGEVLVNHTFDRYSPIGETERMNVFAQEISKILLEETGNFVEKIYAEIPAERDNN